MAWIWSMVVLWHCLGLFFGRLADCCVEGEHGGRKWVRNFRLCSPHVSVETFLPTAATGSFRACVVEHEFLPETKVLACPSLESGDCFCCVVFNFTIR